MYGYGGEGFQVLVVMASSVFLTYQTVENCTLGTLKGPWWRGVFFASVSFSPSEKEMKSRHGQWLTMLNKLANNERVKT
jgi:hypothetical protein